MAIQLQIQTNLGYWQTLNTMSDREPSNIVSYRLQDLSRTHGKRVRAIDTNRGQVVDIVG